MNDKEKIYQILKTINKRKTRIDFNKNLFSQGFDSLDITTLLLAVEEKFNIKLKNDAYDKLSTINNILKYVKKN